MSVKWVEHKGKRILYVDFRGLEEEQLVEQVNAMAQEIAKSPGDLRVLTNFEGARATTKFMSRAKQNMKRPGGDKSREKRGGGYHRDQGGPAGGVQQVHWPEPGVLQDGSLGVGLAG